MAEIIRGPVKVYWDGQDMGYVESDIELNEEPAFVEAKVTCFGDGVFDEMSNGTVMTVTVPLTSTENTVLEKLGGTVVGNDVIFTCPVGTLTRSQAKELVLKPCIDQNPSADPDTWTTVFLTYPKRKFALAYGATQRVFSVEFQAYPSLVSGQIGRYYKLGVNA